VTLSNPDSVDLFTVLNTVRGSVEVLADPGWKKIRIQDLSSGIIFTRAW
jgi:hypothetical protein